MSDAKKIFILLFVGLLNFKPVDSKADIKFEGLFYLDGKPVTIAIKGDKIAEITRTVSEKTEDNQLFIAPGLIDIQINGYSAADFGGENLSLADVRKVTKALWHEGVTCFLPTLISNKHEILIKNLKVLAEALKEQAIAKTIPGFHLEGPYISPEDGYRGAHPKEWVRLPDWQEFEQYVQAANHKILLVTIAPEIDGALPFVRKCRENGIAVAMGHHNAPAEVIKQAVDEGVVLATHLGNGCANLIHRHNNPLWPQLADDRLAASIIADGFHLTPDEVKVFFKSKGAQGIILISDALDVAGLPPGEYKRGGRTILVTPDVIKYPAQNVLAGAAAPLRKDVSNMMKFTQCSLAEAINMAAKNPATLLGLKDRGELQPGSRADLILFAIKDGTIEIEKTVLAGEVVYAKK